MKIPKNEILWETIKTESNIEYIVTSTKDTSKYILYKVNTSDLNKVSTAKTPIELKKFQK